MVDQTTLQTIGILLTGLSVSIAAIYYTLTLRYTRRNQELSLKAQEQALETRQSQLYMNIYARFTDKEFLDMVNEIRQFDYIDFDDFEKKYGQYDRNKIYAVAAVFEGIGVLVKRGLIDIRLVNDLMPLTIMSVWEKLEPILVEARSSDWGSRYAYKGFQYLNNAVVDTYEQQLRDWDI